MGSYHISYMVQHGGENRKDKFVKLLDHIPSKLACEDAIFENQNTELLNFGNIFMFLISILMIPQTEELVIFQKANYGYTCF